MFHAQERFTQGQEAFQVWETVLGRLSGSIHLNQNFDFSAQTPGPAVQDFRGRSALQAMDSVKYFRAGPGFVFLEAPDEIKHRRASP